MYSSGQNQSKLKITTSSSSSPRRRSSTIESEALISRRMSNLPINIHFDYDGYYSKTGDAYQWNPRVPGLYGLSFRTSSMEEITYSRLVDKICMKMRIDESTTKVKLSYIPSGVQPPTYSYIWNDDDVYVYLTTLDKEKRSVLHVEVSNELEIVLLNEQESRVHRRSSVGVNFAEQISDGIDNDRANVDAVTLYANEPLAEQLSEPLARMMCNITSEVRSLYDLCTKYYFVELWVMAYVRTIFPVPHRSEWVIPSEIQELYAFPPVHVVRKGRIQETRYPSVGERRRKSKRVEGRNLESWFPDREGGNQEGGQD